METGIPEGQTIHEKFISSQKCVLLDTMYVILHKELQDTSVFAFCLCRKRFVTGLYLDKPKCLWQYIVEVDHNWHNILCSLPDSGCHFLNFKGKSRIFL